MRCRSLLARDEARCALIGYFSKSLARDGRVSADDGRDYTPVRPRAPIASLDVGNEFLFHDDSHVAGQTRQCQMSFFDTR